MRAFWIPFQGFDVTVLESDNEFGGLDEVGIRGNDQYSSFFDLIFGFWELGSADYALQYHLVYENWFY